MVSGADLPDIELHWRVHWYETEFAERALARARPGPTGVRRLCLQDELASLLLYHARDGFAGLRHAIDVGAWWDGRAGPPAPSLLRAVARTHPGLERALTASAVVLDRVVGVPAGALVDVPAVLPRGVRVAVGLANPLMRGTPEQIMAEVSLVDGLLAPAGERRAYIRRRALPSARELPGPVGRRPLAVARAEHVVRLLRRYALALVRRRPRLALGDVGVSAVTYHRAPCDRSATCSPSSERGPTS
jgi:hypothetical protein